MTKAVKFEQWHRNTLLALFNGSLLIGMATLFGTPFGVALVVFGAAMSVILLVSLTALQRRFGPPEPGVAERPPIVALVAGLALLAMLIATLLWYGLDARQTAGQKDAARQLIEDLDQARAASDLGFLLDTLHPVTFDYWSVADCRQVVSLFLGQRSIDTIEGIEVIGDGQIDYGQGRVAEYEDGYVVLFTNRNGVERSARVAFVDSEARWFTNCDQPSR